MNSSELIFICFLAKLILVLQVTYRSIKIEQGTPSYAAINPNTNTAYLSYTSSGFIIAVNLKKRTIENKFKTNHPKNIVVNNVTNMIYAASADGVLEINGVNNEFEVINIGYHNSSGIVSIDAVMNTLYLCFDNGNSLIVIDALTRSINDIVVGKTMRGAAVDWYNEKIYIPDYECELISVINYSKASNSIDTISIKQRWDTSEYRKPSFVILNRKSDVLYVQTHVTRGYDGVADEVEQLYLIDASTKRTIKTMSLNSNAKGGFTFDPINDVLYMRKKNSILKFDAFGNNKKVLGKIDIEQTSIWKEIFTDVYDYLAEVIAVNPATNKIYVSDSKNNLLYEING